MFGGVGGFGERGQFSAGGHEGVGRQYSRPAGVGDDGQPRPARTRLLAQDFGHIEKVSDILHPQHAALAEGSIATVIAMCGADGSA